jgi:hypothetical protein
MSPQCARRSHPTYDTRLDHGAAGAVVEEPCRCNARRTAAPEGPTPPNSAARETACLLRGSEGLREKGFCLGRARRTNTAWTDAEIVIAAHLAYRKVSKTEEEQRPGKIGKVCQFFAML